MEGWKNWKSSSESSFLTACYRRVRESYVAIWLFNVFQTSAMSTATSGGGGPGGGGGGGVGGALSLMGCVREASPPPQDHHHTLGITEFSTHHNADPVPKEPKKRRFHPLRGLRRIFRRKSRGAADSRTNSNNGERDVDILARDREEVTVRHPSGRPEEARSRSASELLTDSCDKEGSFLRRSGIEESFLKLRGVPGQLSVSHDSVFPGEVPQTRPLSSLDTLATLERRQGRKNDEVVEHKDYNSHVAHRHRISLRVLEQIKTVIENRNQLASATSTDTTNAVHATGHIMESRYQQETTSENRCTSFEKHERRLEEAEGGVKVTRATKDTLDRVESVPKEGLPELEIASLNHTAALHRISVRPKNRRPPRRTAAQTSTSTITTISEHSDLPTSLESTTSLSATNSPGEPKTTSILRKSSSRLSRNSDIFEELEVKLPRKSSSSIVSLSPDSLDALVSPETIDVAEQRQETVTRRPSNRISKGSDVFEELESKLPQRRYSSNLLSKSPDSLENSTWFSKSTEALEDQIKPISAKRSLLKSNLDRVSKSSDSLETIDALTDDSMDRRRSSFEFRNHRAPKVLSKSSENFDQVMQSDVESIQEFQKRSSISDINLYGRRHSKNVSKSSDSFEINEMKEDDDEEDDEDDDDDKCWRKSNKRIAMSSESSDNLELDDRLENRRVRKPPKRIASKSAVDVLPLDGNDNERRVGRKSSRMQKSSESSELGSTDTLDSERRNRSSDSTETLDSLEKDLEQDRKEEEITDSVLDKREKSDAWTTKTESSNADSTAEDSKPMLASDKTPYWRQTSDSKENLDIHQLLAITIVTRMTDNGNNQRASVIYPKKKQSLTTSSPPTSPVTKQEIFNNLLTSKNDEDLQNMLNGNISEVSTDTKSFKEKLIMFEKLGK